MFLMFADFGEYLHCFFKVNKSYQQSVQSVLKHLRISVCGAQEVFNLWIFIWASALYS